MPYHVEWKFNRITSQKMMFQTILIWTDCTYSQKVVFSSRLVHKHSILYTTYIGTRLVSVHLWIAAICFAHIFRIQGNTILKFWKFTVYNATLQVSYNLYNTISFLHLQIALRKWELKFAEKFEILTLAASLSKNIHGRPTYPECCLANL